MFIRIMVALALVAPAAAIAQPASPRVMTVEIMATGQIDAQASSFTLAASWSSQGADEAAANKARTEKNAQVLVALRAAGVPDAAVTRTPPTTTETNELVAAISELPTKSGEAKASVPDNDGDASEDSVPVTMISEGATIRVATLDQATALRKALEALDVSINGEPEAVLDDRDGVRRQAKAKALSSARLDAAAYARELGLRVMRVSRISEAGNGLFLPGLQDKMQQAFTAGPQAMRGMFGASGKPGIVHVEASIIVEFELAP